MAEVKVDIEIKGMKELLSTLNRLDRANMNLKGPLAVIGNKMLRSFNDNFKAQGIPELGITWAPLSKWTLAGRKKRTTGGRRKRNKGKHGPKKLMDTGLMRMSVVQSAHPNNVFDVEPTSVEVGTNINYAQTHQPPGGVPHVNPQRRIPGVVVKEYKRRVRGKKITVREHTRNQFMPRTVVPVRPFVVIKPSDVEVALNILEMYEKQVVEKS